MKKRQRKTPARAKAETSAKNNAAPNASLVLADGSVFFGHGVGAFGTIFGEICFNTSITGYQEILTDPSYAGQIITFTFPHIGNVGANKEDVESRKPFASGLVLREAITNPSNFRSESHLTEWLRKNKLVGISGVDTRALTRHIRLNGAQNAAICYVKPGGKINLAVIKKKLKAQLSMEGRELARQVTGKKAYKWGEGSWKDCSPLAGEQMRGASQDANAKRGGSYRNVQITPHALAATNGLASAAPPQGGSKRPHVVVVDYGIKQNILRCLVEVGCRVTVVPAATPSKKILTLKPDGIFLSNGPGDPAATGKYALPIIKELLKTKIPLFGICLGHQLLGLALGGATEKMHQGHRGANHPVKELATGRVYITSQNHGFVVSDKHLPKGVEVTHRSLFDGTIQGIRAKDKPAFSVQGHPEASPGPHDFQVLFREFVGMMEKRNA